MIDMYEKYGYYKDDIQSVTLKGIEGLAKIQSILDTLRKEPPTEIGGYQVVSARDYKRDTITDLETGEVTLPAFQVLMFSTMTSQTMRGYAYGLPEPSQRLSSIMESREPLCPMPTKNHRLLEKPYWKWLTKCCRRQAFYG